MDVKIYNRLSPTIKFYNQLNIILCEYNSNFEIVNDDYLEQLRKEINLPYKVSFYNIPIEIVNKILNILDTDNAKLFWYREKDSKNDLIAFHAIFTEKIKTKKI